MRWLLDTNVISEATRRTPSTEVLRWIAGQPTESLHTLSLACAEIRAGITRVQNPARRRELEDWLSRKVRPFFGTRILEADEQSWLAMIDLLERTRAKHRTIPVADLIFAAAAERHGMILVTRNLKDFAGTGILALNPWTADPTPQRM